MAGLDDRKDAAEKKYAHDEELAFKANARRAKLLGLWAGEQVGKSGADAEAYAKSVVMADFEEAGDEDVFRKVRADLDAGGRKRCLRPCHPPDHGRADGEGHRAGEGRQLTVEG